MSADVLVLNANFEPIHVCNMRRAINLILADKAILVLNGRGEIHTVRRNFPRPSVIRLMNMIHRPRPQIKLTRREIFRRDAYTCQYCGKKTVDLTIDHVIPRHMGGPHSWIERRGRLLCLQPPQRRAHPGRSRHAPVQNPPRTSGLDPIYIWAPPFRIFRMGALHRWLVIKNNPFPI